MWSSRACDALLLEPRRWNVEHAVHFWVSSQLGRSDAQSLDTCRNWLSNLSAPEQYPGAEHRQYDRVHAGYETSCFVTDYQYYVFVAICEALVPRQILRHSAEHQRLSGTLYRQFGEEKETPR